MINGGNATVFVSDMDRAISFYTTVLGLELRMRADNHWAEVVAGETFVIGIHPESPNAPGPGTAGSIKIGLNVSEPLETVSTRLAEHGVEVDGAIIEGGEAGRFLNLTDPDGNKLYLWQHA